MNKKLRIAIQITILSIIVISILLFATLCILKQMEVANTIDIFGPKTFATFIINRSNHLNSTSIEKEIKAIYKQEYCYIFCGDKIAKYRITEGNACISDKFLDIVTNEDNYFKAPGKTLSQTGSYLLIKEKDGNYIYHIGVRGGKFTISESKTKTPCNRIIYYSRYYLFCTTPDNKKIYMYSILNDLKGIPKILELNKISFISGPKEDYTIVSLYVFDGQFLFHYDENGLIDGRIKLDDVPINDRMSFTGYFNIGDDNEVLFYDGFNAWGISFKDKKVLWKKQIDIIGNGVDRLGCYFVPTKQGIMAISSSTGETKEIVSGNNWRLVSNINNNQSIACYSGNTLIFTRQIDSNKYEPILILATEGKAKVVTCEPFEGEYRGFFFLEDKYKNEFWSIDYSFVFLTKNRVYQYSIKRPFKIIFK